MRLWEKKEFLAGLDEKLEKIFRIKYNTSLFYDFQAGNASFLKVFSRNTYKCTHVFSGKNIGNALTFRFRHGILLSAKNKNHCMTEKETRS